MLTIYDSNGNRRTDIEAGDSSTQVKEVQGDNVLTLSFTHYEYIALDVNDRVDFEGERYWLTERYIPKQKSGQEWVYDLKFYGIESLVRRFLVLETTDWNTEPVFTLTATPREHVAIIGDSFHHLRKLYRQLPHTEKCCLDVIFVKCIQNPIKQFIIPTIDRKSVV